MHLPSRLKVRWSSLTNRHCWVSIRHWQHRIFWADTWMPTCARAPAEGRGAVLAHLLRQAAKTLSDHQQQVLNVAFFESGQQPALNELRAGTLHRSLRTSLPGPGCGCASACGGTGTTGDPAVARRTATCQGHGWARRTFVSCAGDAAFGEILAISGPGGSGKTTLGSHIAADWTSGTHFWFTVRPGFTDNISALLFSLCHWLRVLGATGAWHQLIADAGKDRSPLEFSRIRPMLRHDLEQIRQTQPDQSSSPLVCIDDVDLLDPKRAEHDRVLDVIREMRDLVALLLIGQTLVLETDSHIQLAGLESGDVAEMLRRDQRVFLSSDEVKRLAVATNGLPALVQLFILLHEMGETVESTLRSVEGGMSADALFQRAWVRLSEAQRRLLKQLAGCDGYAPVDEWRDGDEESMAARLAASRVLEIYERDGIAVTSYAWPAVLRRISPNQRPALDLLAAEALDDVATTRPQPGSMCRQVNRSGQSHCGANTGPGRLNAVRRRSTARSCGTSCRSRPAPIMGGASCLRCGPSCIAVRLAR